MKRIMIVMDDDYDYSKKFCNQANKLMGKQYIFIAFESIGEAQEYASKDRIEGMIVSKNNIEQVEEIECSFIYVLNEINREVSREGKKVYIYRLQSVKNILGIINDDIEKRYEHIDKRNFKSQKLVLFYTPVDLKNKIEIIKKFAKYLSKKNTVLIINLDEFGNYKGYVGLSNVFFNYKENKLSIKSLEKEVVNEKGQDFINSVTYPEDFSVISNVDLANVIAEIMRLPYDYIFINADTSYSKIQYVINDADLILLLKEDRSIRVDKFKAYVKNENIIDYKKLYEIDVGKVDRQYISSFAKKVFEI